MDIEAFFAAMQMPPVARLLGWTFAGWDPEAREFSVRFTAREDFVNPAGTVQGGMLTAMIDDTMGPAVVAASGGTRMCRTIDLHSHFLRPVMPGPVLVRARVVRLGQQVAFIEASLFDGDDRLCLRASSSASLGALPAAG